MRRSRAVGAIVVGLFAALLTAEPGLACSTREVAVSVAFSGYPDLAGLVARLEYPQDKLTIPGTENDPEVLARLTSLTSGILSGRDDDFDNDGIDERLEVGLISPSPTIPSGAFAEVEFDCLAGGDSVGAADFACTVVDATTSSGTDISGATCSVVVE
ncbi:MAG: hypothetical protein AB1689_29450 [Thermodesulfobacteriota bacterium]